MPAGLQARGVDALDLHAGQAAPATQQQINPGALMRRPEPGLVVGLDGQHLLDHEAFQGRVQLRMRQQGMGYALMENLQTVPPPAIAHAIYNAIGVRIRELPITPEKILAGLGRLPDG